MPPSRNNDESTTTPSQQRICCDTTARTSISDTPAPDRTPIPYNQVPPNSPVTPHIEAPAWWELDNDDPLPEHHRDSSFQQPTRLDEEGFTRAKYYWEYCAATLFDQYCSFRDAVERAVRDDVTGEDWHRCHQLRVQQEGLRALTDQVQRIADAYATQS